MYATATKMAKKSNEGKMIQSKTVLLQKQILHMTLLN